MRNKSVPIPLTIHIIQPRVPFWSMIGAEGRIEVSVDSMFAVL